VRVSRQQMQEEGLLLTLHLAYIKEHASQLCHSLQDPKAVQSLRGKLLIRRQTCSAALAGGTSGKSAVHSFGTTERLLLPSCYTKLDSLSTETAGLETVLREDQSAWMVDPCYLGIRRPGQDPKSNDPSEQQHSWCTFLMELGCCLLPPLVPNQYVLSPVQAKEQFSVQSAGPVQVQDWALPAELRKALAMAQSNTSAGGALALFAVLDQHWQQTYAKSAKCTLSYTPVNGKHIVRTQAAAAFVKELRATLVVPTSQGKRPLSQAFARTPELLRLFGAHSVPFLLQEPGCADMARALGLTGEITTELGLAVLRAEHAAASAGSSSAGSSAPSSGPTPPQPSTGLSLPPGVVVSASAVKLAGMMARVKAAYEILRLRFEQGDGAAIRQAFAAEPLIYVPAVSAGDAAGSVGCTRWFVTAQTCWHGSEAQFGTPHGLLEPHYSGSETSGGLLGFFKGLGVPMYLGVRDLADRLVEVALVHAHSGGMPVREADRQLVTRLYQRLDLWLCFSAGQELTAAENHADTSSSGGSGISPVESWPEPVQLDWQCLQHLHTQPVFLTGSGLFWSARRVLVPDDTELAQLFENASAEGGPALLCCGTMISRFAKLFGLRTLSSSVQLHYGGGRNDGGISPQQPPGVAVPGWTTKLHHCAAALVRWMQGTHPQLTAQLAEQAGAAQLLGRLSCRACSPLRVRYALQPAATPDMQDQHARPIQRGAPRAALAVPTLGVLLLDPDMHAEQPEVLAGELVRMLFSAPPGRLSGALEAASNIGELLIAKQTVVAMERMLVSRGIGPLPDTLAHSLGLDSQRAEDLPPLEYRVAPPQHAAASRDVGVAAAAAAVDVDDSDLSHGGTVRPVSAAHRDSTVARQQAQGRDVELRCAREEALRLWPAVSAGGATAHPRAHLHHTALVARSLARLFPWLACVLGLTIVQAPSRGERSLTSSVASTRCSHPLDLLPRRLLRITCPCRLVVVVVVVVRRDTVVTRVRRVQLGARGGGLQLVDLRRPGCEPSINRYQCHLRCRVAPPISVNSRWAVVGGEPAVAGLLHAHFENSKTGGGCSGTENTRAGSPSVLCVRLRPQS
jgi:hypothetical protein